VVPSPAGAPGATRTATAVTTQIRPKDTLISRFGLESRLSATDVAPSLEKDAGGSAMWEDTAERREASLRERKAQMILAARQYVQSSLLAHHYKLTACSLGKANASRTTDTSRVPCRITTWVLSCLHARFLLTGPDCNTFRIDFCNRTPYFTQRSGVILLLCLTAS
jgi:hypothetical protein